LDRPYKLEIVSPGNKGELHVCRLALTLGYIMELSGLQRAYDNYVLHQDQLSLHVKRELFKSAAHLVWPPPPQGGEGTNEYLQPIVAQLNRDLENLGLKIETAACTFTAAPTLVRLVAEGQESVEKALAPGAASD
ncbi:MAG TPA: hypothetical protein VI389_03485, partial [Geobacteraceae bacterium]